MRTVRSRSIARFSVALIGAATYGLLVIAPGGASTAPPTDYRHQWNRPPLEADYALLTFANMDRADPAQMGYPQYQPQRPFVWNDKLATAARYHSWDMLTNGCSQHDSCNGQKWDKRISKYYPRWWSLGENLSAGSEPWINNSSWMASPGHRANILSSNIEFGAGTIPDVFGGDATEDFGSRATVAIPALPAGTVYLPPERQRDATWRWQLFLNYYDAQGRTPTAVKAIFDGQTANLALAYGTNTNGTYRGDFVTPGWPTDGSWPTLFCKRGHFELTRSDGQTFRYPATGEIGLGYTDRCDLRTAEGSTAPPPPGGAPNVTIASPGGGRVSGVVEIRASATDDVDVTRMEVYIDGRRVARRSASAMVWRWDTRRNAWTPGSHAITVKAYDAAGNVGTATVTVTKEAEKTQRDGTR